jgi:putative ABC transport system permease protein
MTSLLRLAEIRVAIRYLRKTPAFTVTAVLMLAIGIGATTAIFSVVEGVLLRPLPFPHPERLMVVTDLVQGIPAGLELRGNGESGVTGYDIQAFMRDSHSFESIGGYQQSGYELSGAGDPAQINAARLSGEAARALDIAPLKGRWFTQQEDDQKQQLAVISYSFWQDRLHGNAAVLGAKFQLDRKVYEVIGVMPPGFEFPLQPGRLNRNEAWLPLSLTQSELSFAAGAAWGFDMVGRLKPGITPLQATNDVERVVNQTMRDHPLAETGFTWNAIVRPLHEESVERSRPLVRTLFLAIFVVMLIACANLAGLLLVRAIRRRREIAVRMALGEPTGKVLRLAIFESLVLSLAGGALGLVLAENLVRVGVSRLPETLPRVNEIGVDWRVGLFAMALAVGTGLLCGLAPAFAAMRTSVNETLKEGGRTGSAGGAHARLRSALVVGEIAVAMVLLVACSLLLRSFEKMRAVDLGFRPDHTLSAYFSLPEQPYGNQKAINELEDELIRRVQHLPGVKFVGFSSFLPDTPATGKTVFLAEGYVPPPGNGQPLAIQDNVRGDYLQAMGVPLLRGRYFTPADTPDSQRVVIVTHNLAQHYWPGVDPIGKRIRFDSQETNKGRWITIVGEVADVKDGSRDTPSLEQIYLPVDQVEADLGAWATPADLNLSYGYLALRTETPPEQMTRALNATLRSVDPQLALDHVRSMEQAVSESEAPRRFNTVLISAFAIAAVLLAALGIYSIMAFSTALRTQEIAIRLAMGSQRTGILRLVFASAAKLAILGCVLGLAGTAAVSRMLQSLLFGVNSFDPVVLALALIFVLLLALAASFVPARRAASIEPIQALRAD